MTFGWNPEAGRTGVTKRTLPPKFTIDNRQFAERGLTVDQCVQLGNTQNDRVQDWVIENMTPTAHPFHIHINPFQVRSIETPSIDKNGVATYTRYVPASDFMWQDVIALPAGVTISGTANSGTNPAPTQGVLPGRVTIRQRFVDFPGTFVLHCHILAHEDRGMMQLVRVVPPADYPAKCQENVPQHH